MIRIPAHKQTDPAKYPGQIVNPITPTARRIRGSLGEIIDRMQRDERAAQLFHKTAKELVAAAEVVA